MGLWDSRTTLVGLWEHRLVVSLLVVECHLPEPPLLSVNSFCVCVHVVRQSRTPPCVDAVAGRFGHINRAYSQIHLVAHHVRTNT